MLQPISPRSAAPHMPQLDGLRAIAVAGVVTAHNSLWGDIGLWAYLGVKLFFALSGFLITGILLRSRENAAALKLGWASVLWKFYARRVLRIFPLYYGVIAVAFAINLEPTREIIGWLLTYTLNIYMANQGWFVDHFAHFWTLAVEEQFYVLWPWLVVLTPRKWLVALMLLFIGVGPTYRYYAAVNALNGVSMYVFTLACVDSLGMGALLAVFSQPIYPQHAVRRCLNWIALPAGASLSVLLYWLFSFDYPAQFAFIFFDLALALFFCWLISSAARGFGGLAGWALSSKPLTYVGKISYGIYVYHEFMPSLCRWFAGRLGVTYPERTWVQFALIILLTVVTASISWYLLEKPLNDLKRYFDDKPMAENATSEVGKSPSWQDA
jgi:peptidoglycan/LPS O-acetylase OafA/YrhL